MDLYDKISLLGADVAVLKSQYKYSVDKIDEIHKILVGNGKPGLKDEFNRWKGIVKGISITFGIMIAALSALVTIKGLI